MSFCADIRKAFVSNVTRSIDLFFDVAKFGAHQNVAQFQFFICLVNLIFSIYPIVWLLLLRDDMHVLFWLGSVPFYVNISVPIAITGLNIGVNICRCAKPRTGTAKGLCFVLFLLIGSVLLGSGSYLQYESLTVSEELVDECGKSPLSATVETEWQALWRFYEQCQAQTGHVEIISACPGYGRAFPESHEPDGEPEHEFVYYIEAMENDFDCVGFCQSEGKPLFNADSDHELRCATVVGERILMVGNMISYPTMATGLFVCCLGACIAAYDHL